MGRIPGFKIGVELVGLFFFCVLPVYLTCLFRFGDKEQKLIKQTSFPPEFETKIDLTKIQMEVLTPWITQKITELLGVEDDILASLVMNLLEEEKVGPEEKKRKEKR